MSNEEETKEKRINAMKYKILKLDQARESKNQGENHRSDGGNYSPNHHRRSQEKLLRWRAMLIKTLKMENFRQFRWISMVDFSLDPE